MTPYANARGLKTIWLVGWVRRSYTAPSRQIENARARQAHGNRARHCRSRPIHQGDDANNPRRCCHEDADHGSDRLRQYDQAGTSRPRGTAEGQGRQVLDQGEDHRRPQSVALPRLLPPYVH